MTSKKKLIENKLYKTTKDVLRKLETFPLEPKNSSIKILETTVQAPEKNITLLKQKTKKENIDYQLAKTFFTLIKSELQRIDSDSFYTNLTKKLKNTLVSRSFFDYLFKADKKLPEFEKAKKALFSAYKTAPDEYLSDTIHFCYDRLNIIEYADLYKPASSQGLSRYCKDSELYQASWQVNEEINFQGTFEIIHDPLLTIENNLLVTNDILKLLDDVSSASQEYVPMSLELIKKHFFKSNLMIVARKREPKHNKEIVVGIGVALKKTVNNIPICYLPAIFCEPEEKNQIGLFLVSALVRYFPDYGKKDIICSCFTNNKPVVDLMKMAKYDLQDFFNSGIHWSNLSEKEKNEINDIMLCCGGKNKKNNYVLDENGVDRNRYPLGYRPNTSPKPLKELRLDIADAIFTMNYIPKSIKKFTNNKNLNNIPNRRFKIFVNTIKQIDSFVKIKP